MKRINLTKQLEQEKNCDICHKRPVEIYQLDYEVCCKCHQMETEVRFMDQYIPEI
jgi:hypothetical protein